MTEREINALRRILRRSTLADTSPEFDDALKQHARVGAHQDFSLSSSWLQFAPILTSLIILVAFTSLFILESKPDMTTASQAKQVSYVSVASSSDNSRDSSVQRPVKPIRPDVILPDFELQQRTLPTSYEVISLLDLPLSVDRESLRQNIEIALLEIEVLLDEGRVPEARSRYKVLLSSCPSCQIPKNLDGLMMDNRTGLRPDHGPIYFVLSG